MAYMADIVGWRGFNLETHRNGRFSQWEKDENFDSKISSSLEIVPPVFRGDLKYSPLDMNVDPNMKDGMEPGLENNYGFWAFKRRTELEKYFLHLPIKKFRNLHKPHGEKIWGAQHQLFATIRMYGTVIEHEKGYRSSAFQILNFYSFGNNSERRHIAHRLGWPGKILPLEKGKESYKPTFIEIPDSEV